MVDPDITLLKRQHRQQLRQRRDGLDQVQCGKFGRRIMKNVIKLDEFRAARRIFSYISHGKEVDTHALIRRYLQTLDVLAVPKILDKTKMVAVRFSDWHDLLPDAMGILTPVSDAVCIDPFDVAIMPGLGFTRQGVRIGYGRGYYDRWLQQHPATIRIALCYSMQLTPTLPQGQFDMPVDIIVTEAEIIRPQLSNRV